MTKPNEPAKRRLGPEEIEAFMLGIRKKLQAAIPFGRVQALAGVVIDQLGKRAGIFGAIQAAFAVRAGDQAPLASPRANGGARLATVSEPAASVGAQSRFIGTKTISSSHQE